MGLIDDYCLGTRVQTADPNISTSLHHNVDLRFLGSPSALEFCSKNALSVVGDVKEAVLILLLVIDV